MTTTGPRAVACLIIAAAAIAAVAARAQESGPDRPALSGMVEGRPTGSAVSPLQATIDAAVPGATVIVEPGVYDGDVIIDKPLRLRGRSRPVLRGSGEGSVVRVRADDVTVEGFAIDGRGGGDLGRDSSGIHVTGRRVVVRDCVVRGALFGIYLREADGARVEDNQIDGIPGKTPGEKGSGIHVWNTNGFRLTGNRLHDVRDGLYIQASPNGYVARNIAADLRYGLHYMFSDDNVFEDNRFENGAAGAALMYSRRLTFRRNAFVHNRGFASVGLLMKNCEDVRAEDNLVADNARGVFMEGAVRSVFVRNVIAESDVALVLYDSNAGVRFEGNSFVANLSPLQLVGRRTDTVVRGNYWSDQEQLDLDGDGIADRPYRLSNAFDHLRGNLTAADLFAQGVAAHALGVAERTFPVIDLVSVVDDRPLAHPPDLPAVPSGSSRAEGGPSAAGLGLSGAALLTGAWAGVVGYRGRRFRPSTDPRQPERGDGGGVRP